MLSKSVCTHLLAMFAGGTCAIAGQILSEAPHRAAAHAATITPSPGYHAVLTILVNGSDGTLAAEREITLPFVPTAGIGLDLFEVQHVGWSTRRQAFMLRCQALNVPTMPARDALKTFAAGATWKEHFFNAKKTLP